jgi:hypothetical protein
MPRLTKKQKVQFAELKSRAERAERDASTIADFKYALVEFLRDDIVSIAREECESLLDDAQISY